MKFQKIVLLIDTYLVLTNITDEVVSYNKYHNIDGANFALAQV